MDYRLRRNESGYSLIELMVALGLIGMVLSLGYSLYMLGVNYHTRGNERATLQQEERYLQEYLSREFRFAHDVGLFASLEDVPALTEDQIILYSDSRGIWRKRAGSEAQLVLAAHRVHYDLQFNWKDDTGMLLVDHKIYGIKNPPPDAGKKLAIKLFNSASVEASGKVIRYSSE